MSIGYTPVGRRYLWILYKVKIVFIYKMKQNEFHCISLIFAFTFDDFKSLLQNFSLNWAGSKFENFGLYDGKSWNSQYSSYLPEAYAMLVTACPHLGWHAKCCTVACKNLKTMHSANTARCMTSMLLLRVWRLAGNTNWMVDSWPPH
jgi:hypothetical protein